MYNMQGMYNSGIYPWMMPQFRDPQKWLSDLEAAIADQAKAIGFYAYLMSIAPNDQARNQINFAREDEMKHHRMLTGLYTRLTGRHPAAARPVIEKTDFATGVFDSFNDELEAMDHYRGMMLATCDRYIRDLLFEIMTDEMEHANRFTMIMAMDWAETD